MINTSRGFPPQQLSFSRKNKTWRKQCVDFADSRSFIHYHLTRKSVFGMKINYDLLNGKLHMEDLKLLTNPYDLDASFIPDNIQHYPILNSKLQVLRGEESKRIFDFRVVVTNPNAISDIEENKKQIVLQNLQELVQNTSISEEDFQQRLQKLSDYFTYEWQDMREVRANQMLNHYMKELDVQQLFNIGFLDAMTVGEEIYQCDIVGGEPTIEKLDPRKVRILRSGYSNKIEDADIIILEDYWSPGKIIDTYWDSLSKSDLEYIEKQPDHLGNAEVDSMDNIDDRYGFVHGTMIGDEVASNGGFQYDPLYLFDNSIDSSLLPYDMEGNIRVLKVYWKSRRKIKKVKSYDPETGEEQFNFYPETYISQEDLGEEEESFWINEAWEGVKIGSDIYVNMRPRPIQYNRLSNPSRCHFGIIGSIYNVNGDQPFSMVDMMKPYNYFYDIIHDKLNKLIAKNWGKLIKLDLAKIPKKWDVDKWMYYAKVNNIVVEDSFKEGNIGAATGKLAGALNNASSGVVDAGFGNEIQYYINLLEVIDQHMGNVAGISKQREGQVSNRETVGGVERATLQSSHITEWLFFIHDSVKKRVLECLLETIKIAAKGRSLKFSYILSDGSRSLTNIDGDEFAECDYGLIVDNSNGAQELQQKLDTLAQAALQNQLLDFSTIMKLYTTISLAEKQRMVEANERRVREQQQQAQQQQVQLQQQQLQQQAQTEQQKQELEYKMHQEDNETKILVAEINGQAEEKRFAMMQEDNGITADQQYALQQQELQEKIRQFDATLKQNADKQAFERKKHEDDVRLKDRQIDISARKKSSN